jgi:hypothetical protein
MRVINADRPYEPGSAQERSPSAPSDLHTVFNARALYHGAKHEEQAELLSVYNGNIPPEYDDQFHPEQRVHIVNMLRLSWDDLAGMAGQEFPLFSAPENDKAAAKERAEKRETVCYGYNAAGRKNGGVDMAGLQRVQGFYMVGFGEAVWMVLPDYKRKTPYFTFRDPRSHFPPIGWNPWEQSDLEGTMFAYRMTLGEIKRRWPGRADDLDIKYAKNSFGRQTTGWKGDSTMDAGGGPGDEDSRWIWVGEYYHSDAWFVSTMEECTVTLLESHQGLDKNHPGVNPVFAHQLINPEHARSLLADQVSIQVAESRMFSQQIDYFDRTLYAPIFGSKLKNSKVRYGPGAYNEFDTTQGEKPAFYQAAPPNPVHADQMMQFGLVLLRMLNRNPEAFQGSGDADSAKAINELKAGVSSTVQTVFWPPMMQALPQGYSKAIRMDINVWGAERKIISGLTPETHNTKRGVRVSTSYRPLQDLLGHEDNVEIEPGIMLRGYQGRLEIMQLLGAGLVSETTALELMDIIRDPREESRRIQSDRLAQLLFADLAKAAQDGRLMPGALYEIKSKTEEGTDIFEVIANLEEAGRLTVPPAPAEGAGMPALGPGGPQAIEQMAASLEAGRTAAPSLELLSA